MNNFVNWLGALMLMLLVLRIFVLACFAGGIVGLLVACGRHWAKVRRNRDYNG